VIDRKKNIALSDTKRNDVADTFGSDPEDLTP
jgi:hypothetical protein